MIRKILLVVVFILFLSSLIWINHLYHKINYYKALSSVKLGEMNYKVTTDGIAFKNVMDKDLYVTSVDNIGILKKDESYKLVSGNTLEFESLKKVVLFIE